jgi:hypothetical protein
MASLTKLLNYPTTLPELHWVFRKLPGSDR